MNKKKIKKKQAKSRRRMASAIAFLAIIADIVGIYSFFIGGNVNNFFSGIWFVNIAVIFAFLFIAIFFLSLSNHSKFRNALLSFYCYSFISITILFYLFFGYNQFVGRLNVSGFLGCILIIFLFGCSSFIILSFLVEQKIADKFLLERNSYFFFFSSLLLGIAFLFKYIVQENIIQIVSVILEISTILFGGGIAFFLFKMSQANQMLYRSIRYMKEVRILQYLFI